MRRIHTIFISVVLLIPLASTRAAEPDLETDELASGPYATMSMLLEKTIFGVDVMDVDMRFDEDSQEQFREIAAGTEYSEERANRIARVAVGARNVHVQLRFQRDVELERFVEAVRENLRKARDAGLIDEESYRDTSDALPRWFSAVSDRGFEDGDRLLYRGYPDRLRTVLVSKRGEVLLDQVDEGEAPRRTLLSGYFAPGTDFREPLIRSLFEEE